MGAKFSGSTDIERTKGWRWGLASRKSQKSKALSLVYKIALATKKQRLRGRRSRHVSEKLSIDSGVMGHRYRCGVPIAGSYEWLMTLSITSQGRRGDVLDGSGGDSMGR